MYIHKPKDNMIIVSDLLKDLGVSPNLVGYRYIRLAVCFLLDNPSKLDCNLEYLYKKIGSNFDSSRSKVERGIRTCIDRMKITGNLDMMVKVFGHWAPRSSGRLTNKQFILGLVDYVSTYLK